jgi:hypothetical protein
MTTAKLVLAAHDLADGGTHAVYARTAEYDCYRVSDPTTWDDAQSQWTRLDDARRAGRFPHVQHFEVRSTSDPKYVKAGLAILYRHPVVNPRGNKNVEDAARLAWYRWAGEEPHGKRQGRGGWFYYPNGRPAAQSLWSLARVCQAKKLVVRGVSGRWHAVDWDSEIRNAGEES